MNGNYRFSYLKNCGCVISERALKEVKSDVCLKCNQQFAQDDIIPINGTNEEIENLRIKIDATRSKSKNEKNKKKRKLNDNNDQVKKGDSKIKVFKNIIVKTSATLLLPAKAKNDYSIAKDANASEIYKSLFTTHKDGMFLTYTALFLIINFKIIFF